MNPKIDYKPYEQVAPSMIKQSGSVQYLPVAQSSKLSSQRGGGMTPIVSKVSIDDFVRNSTAASRHKNLPLKQPSSKAGFNKQ